MSQDAVTRCNPYSSDNLKSNFKHRMTEGYLHALRDSYTCLDASQDV